MEKERLIRLLKEMAATAAACSEIWERDGHTEMALRAKEKMIVLDNVVSMLEDEKFFKDIENIYIPVEA